LAFLDVYWGAIAGILGAFCIGLGFTIYKQASDSIDVVGLNYIRACLGMLFFVLCMVLLKKLDIMFALSQRITIFLILSVIFNVLIADTLYFRAQQLIGVSKAFPIVNMNPLFTLFFAHLLLGEPLTERLFVGVVLVLSGVYLVARPNESRSQSRETDSLLLPRTLWLGLILAFTATLSWTFGTICLRIGVQDTDIFVVGAVRYVAVIILMFPVYGFTQHKLGNNFQNYSIFHIFSAKKRQLLYLIVGGAVLNIMLGGVFFFTSVKELGASRSVAITSISPLFGVGFSALLLGEKVSRITILGALMTAIGVWLVV
jgi:drug/metabolite transporter (DMT)-like permease